MYKNLDVYLEEISKYLVGHPDKNEILMEIKSHILDSTESEHSEINEQNLERMIQQFGAPEIIVQNYLEDQVIIKGHYRYQWFQYIVILFALSFSTTLITHILGESLYIFPFLYIPSISTLELILYVPMLFFFDLGLVTFVLYKMSHSKKQYDLPVYKEKKRKERKIASKIFAAILGMFLIGCIYVFNKYNTIFIIIKTMKNDVQPIFGNDPPLLSILVMCLILLEILQLLLKKILSMRIAFTVIQFGLLVVIIGLYKDLSIIAIEGESLKSLWILITLLFTYSLIKTTLKVINKGLTKRR